MIGRRYEGTERRDGDDRRHHPPHWLAWLPLGLAIAAAVGGFYRMDTSIEFLKERITQLEESERAQWQRIGDLMDDY